MWRLYQDQDQDLKLETKTLHIKTMTTFLVLEESRDQDPKFQDYISETVYC